jgi:hypothetical protein
MLQRHGAAPSLQRAVKQNKNKNAFSKPRRRTPHPAPREGAKLGAVPFAPSPAASHAGHGERRWPPCEVSANGANGTAPNRTLVCAPLSPVRLHRAKRHKKTSAF